VAIHVPEQSKRESQPLHRLRAGVRPGFPLLAQVRAHALDGAAQQVLFASKVIVEGRSADFRPIENVLDRSFLVASIHDQKEQGLLGGECR
jgi:hypothetical protein